MQSVRESIEQAFPFTVDRYSAYIDIDGQRVETGQDFLARSDQARQPGLVRRGSVSPKYVPHATEDIVTLAEAAAGAFPDNGGWGTQVRCSWRYGHIVEIAPSKEHQRQAAREDKIFPRICIQAKYNDASVLFNAGMNVHKCENLLLPKLVKGCSARLRHVSDLGSKLGHLATLCRNLAGQWEGLVDWSQQLTEKRVDLAQFVKDVYGPGDEQPGRKRTNSDRRIEAIFTRVAREREKMGLKFLNNYGTWEVTGFEAYNACQGFSQWDQSRRTRDPLARAIAASEDKYVRRAEQLLSAAV